MAPAKISEAEAEPRVISTANGPSHATPWLRSLLTVTRPPDSRTCTTGPCSMNRPVSSIASSSEPPPLLRRSSTTPSSLSFLKPASSLATSRVAEA
ncbi:hypothetical protein G6F60_015460 [Rhizopus arrhizus]|nr:hypothetical protein G6F60_015460 [Rhizopus arrhizus]